MIKNQRENNNDGPDWALARRHNNGYDTTKATNFTVAKNRDGAKLCEQLFRYREITEAYRRVYFMPLEDNNQVMVIKRGEKWFDAAMLRDSVELYRVTDNACHLHSFESSLRQAYKEKTPQQQRVVTNQLLRQRSKLTRGRARRPQRKGLLTQTEMIEIMTRLLNIK